MVQLTIDQRVFVVEQYFKTGSFDQVRDLFRNQFPDREPPTAMNIWKNVRKYRSTETSLNRNVGNSGRPKTGRTQENIQRVQELLETNPHLSCRRNGLAISKDTFNRVVNKDLKWHTYRIRMRHQLKEGDFE